MTWSTAEAAIRSHIETQWAVGAYTQFPLNFDNERPPYDGRYVAVYIEGVYAEKTVYGSVGKRMSIEAGVVFFHAFVPTGVGKSEVVGAVEAMTAILELQLLGDSVRLEGGAPPSPVAYGAQIDRGLPNRDAQPGGAYYLCSGSVPFIVIDSR